MGPVIQMVTSLFKDLNYIYAVELVVIASIAVFVLYVFHALGLLKKSK